MQNGSHSCLCSVQYKVQKQVEMYVSQCGQRDTSQRHLHTGDSCMQLLHRLQAEPIEHLVGLLSTHIKLLSQMQVGSQNVNWLSPAAAT